MRQNEDVTSRSPIAPFEPENYLGTVIEVTASTLLFTFDSEPSSNGSAARSLAGNAEVGSHIIIAVQNNGILGKLNEITTDFGASGMQQIGVVSFSHTLDGKSGDIISGVATMPRVGSKVFIADPRLVKAAAETTLKNADGTDALTISFARLPDESNTRLRFTPEMVYGRHCAVIGTTGGGKSWTVAKLVEETAKLRSKIILFDATGEYGGLRDAVHHVYLGHHPKPNEFMREVVVPYYELTERDLFAVFRPNGPSQAPKLRAAIKSLKLARLSPELALDGTIMKANRTKKDYQRAYKEHYNEVEDQRAAFDIKHLARQIEHECVRPNRSAMEPQFWGDISAVDQAHCVSMINRIRDITQSVNLAPIFDPHGKPSLLRVIDAFLDDESARVLCVSLQYLSFAHNAREIVANATGRHLMRLAQKERFRRKPLLILVDEAHQFLNKRLTDPDGEYPLDAFNLIAKEGRKYALSIGLATQRPRDIPEAVLSQMGTLIIHRLINDRDRGVVERASGEIDHASLAALPTLAPGEAVVLGSDFPIPLQVQVEPPETPPNSRGPDFQKYWNY